MRCYGRRVAIGVRDRARVRIRVTVRDRARVRIKVTVRVRGRVRVRVKSRVRISVRAVGFVRAPRHPCLLLPLRPLRPLLAPGEMP